jgi:hypothetical protein
MPRDDYTLSIEEVAKRLNKSVRTVHRYKDGGRLSFVTGATQGNPLFFSRSEVDELARELFPSLAQPAATADGQFWEKLDRMERLLAVLEQNPALEQALTTAGAPKPDQRHELELMIERLIRPGGSARRIDNRELGRLLVRLGNMLMEE